MPSRNVVCFLRVRIYYTIALKRGVRTHWPITGSLTTIDNSRWTSDSRWHIFFEPTSKLMMYLLSLQSIKEMTTTGKKDTVNGIFFPPFQCLKLGVFWCCGNFCSPLWGCAGDRVEMVVKVRYGTVLGDEFAAMLKSRPQNSPTMHLTIISTRFPAQPQTSELCCGLQYRWKVSHPSRLVSCATRIA